MKQALWNIYLLWIYFFLQLNLATKPELINRRQQRIKTVDTRVPQQSLTRNTTLHKSPILKSRPRITPAKPNLIKQREPVKEVRKKHEVEKIDEMPVTDPPSTDKPSVGNYELNELMTTMLDAELDDIMPKVQEELSNIISCQKGIFAFDATIKKTTDCLRNVLGLNVTKRLLNVFNSLYVKIKFHGQPNKENLREFLLKYHFRSFARKSVNIFIAKLRNIEDFDNLFSGKEVRCGSVKITVSPVYSFTTCPTNLITKYSKTSSVEESNNKDIATDDGEKDVMNDNKTPTVTKTSPKKPEDFSKKTEKVSDSVNKAIPKNNTSKTEVNASAAESKMTHIKETVSEATRKAASVTATKTVSNNITPHNTGSEKSIEKTTKDEQKLSQNATVTPQKSTNTTVTTQTASNAAETSQKAIISTQLTKKPVSNTAVTSQKSTNTATKTQKFTKSATNATAKRICAAVTTGKSTKPLSNTPKIPQNSPKSATALQTSTKSVAKNDYDELDDHDILALISQGIVLDECSGSDED